MKNFLTTALGAFVGTLVAMFLATIIMTIMSIMMFAMSAIAFGSGSKDNVSIDKNSVLLVNLEGGFNDCEDAGNVFLALMGETEGETATYDQLVKALDVAAENENIVGVVLKANGLVCGTAKAYEVHEALANFKAKTDKWVYAYGDNYTQGEYYLASVADSVFVNTQGTVNLLGLSTELPYFKKLLDKVGVKAEIFKVGTFKSAVEPYMLEHISDANRLQTEQYLNSIWKRIATGISEGRGVKVADVDAWVDSIAPLQPTDFLIDNKIVDRKLYEFEFEDVLRRTLLLDDDTDINFVSVADAATLFTEPDNTDGDIAVIYAQGEINSSADDNAINYEEINEYILDAAEDDDIKGLVFRVNSPGGSAFDSEQMWAAIEKFKATGKPVAVSMGDYAASGGYYISCGANRIFAEPTTLTGSIGIFGMMFNMSTLSKNIGVNFESISTHEIGKLSAFNDMPATVRNRFQQMVNNGYELFTGRCAAGRNMPIDSIKAIAEGRVWTGEMALNIGLVDELGGIEDAIDWVAKEAGIDNPDIVKPQSGDEDIMKAFRRYIKRSMRPSFGAEIDAVIAEKERIVDAFEKSPIQARMLEQYTW